MHVKSHDRKILEPFHICIYSQTFWQGVFSYNRFCKVLSVIRLAFSTDL